MRYYLTLILFGLLPFARAQSVLSATQWKLDQKDQELHFTADSIKVFTGEVVTGRYSYLLRSDTLSILPGPPTKTGGPDLPGQSVIRLEGNGEMLQLFTLDKNRSQPASVGLHVKRAANLPAYDWSYRSLQRDSVPGCSYYDACALLTSIPARPIIVGVIDTGTDLTHAQLRRSIWINPKEKQGNKLDDDKNGYIDDVHGWYWTALNNGKFLINDHSEAVRVLQGDSLGDTNPGVTQQARSIYRDESERLALLKLALSDTARLRRTMTSFVPYVGSGTVTIKTLQDLPDGPDSLHKAVRRLTIETFRGRPTNWTQLSARLIGLATRLHAAYSDMWNYTFNLDYKPLTNGIRFRGQGEGPKMTEPEVLAHGTYVSGVLTAPLSFAIDQVDGQYIKIMDLGAAPPSGDERDELLAKSIRYAVDNGASVINISVAKKLSPHRSLVDAALLHAQKKDVLIVNCAGNDSNDNDLIPYFPVGPVNTLRGDGTENNFIEVGNSSYEWNEKLAFYSSNYGTSVDLFAPGLQIRTTAPGQQYATVSGTSLSAPLVARVAALLRSHFPELSAVEVKGILVESVRKPAFKVVKPGTTQLVSMSQLCRSGGILDAEAAVRLAIGRSKRGK